MSGKKKIFPKIKKSLAGFLTDESGKVTKKDILGVSAGAFVFSVLGVENTLAAPPPCTHISNTPHSSSCSATSQAAISGYTSGSSVSRTLVGSSFSYTSGTASPPNHGSAMNGASGHGNSNATPGASVTAYNSGGHMSYTSRGSATSQPSISGYTHSSGGTHTSYMTPGICP